MPWAQDKVGRGREVNVPPQEALLQKGKRNANVLSRKRQLERRPNEGECKSVWVPRGDEGALEMQPRNHECKHATTPQGVARREVESLP